MGNPLRDRHTLAELAERRQVIEISEKISSFQRLAGIVEADLAALDADKLPRGWRESAVTGRLEFDFLDAQRRLVVLEGWVAATVDAVCQRCLEPFRLELSSELHLLPMSAKEGTSADETFEVWELDDDTICPADVVEESLIMSIPFTAVHDNMAACGSIEAESDDEVQTTRPFAGLKAQLDENR